MKMLLRSFALIVIFFNVSAYGAVTSEQLGQLLLKENYSQVNQEYLAYYPEGPTSKTTFGGYHPGIDYRARSPLAVYSPVSGIVSSTGSLGRVSIRISGTNDYFIFLHLSSFNVATGKNINVGDKIGLSGAEGTTAAHLHVEVRTGKDLAAYYFTNKSNTGVNKNPVSVVAATPSSNTNTYDGKDPNTEKCSADAKTVASKLDNATGGTIELRWSNKCKTNWARLLTNSANASASTTVTITRTGSDGKQYKYSGRGQIYSPMVYTPNNIKACASGTINSYALAQACY